MLRNDTNDAVVAIDGPAGAGKSAVARKVAAALGYAWLDTGAMYRAVTLACLRAGLREPLDERGVADVVARLDVRVAPDSRVYLGAEEVTAFLRTPEVTDLVSAVAAIAAVRRALVTLQRRAAGCVARAGGGIVVDGRDIGSHVFPAARHRFFLDAAVEERARRRAAQEGDGTSVAAWVARLCERDRKDSRRALAPLRVAEGARVIDTTALTEDEVVAVIVDAVRS